MAPRSTWKGFLKLALITCPVKLYKATSEDEPASFTQINRKTLHRVETRRFDAVTGKEVPSEDIGRGVEIATGKYVEVTDDELAAGAPPSALVLEIDELVPAAGMSWLYPDGRYYLGPEGVGALEAFALIRDAIRTTRLVALGRLTLGRREHPVMLQPGHRVLQLSTLRYPTELRDEETCFPKLVDIAPPADLVKPALAIAQNLAAEFDPSRRTDRYAAALAELVTAKITGRMVQPPRALAPPRMLDLATAVHRSAGFAAKPGSRAKAKPEKSGRAA